MVAQVVKVLALHTRDPIWAPVLIPAAPLPFQLPACGLGKQSRTAQGFGTLHPCGRPGRGSWLQIGIVSAVALTWGVNHRMEDLPLCLSSLYIRLSNKKKKKPLHSLTLTAICLVCFEYFYNFYLYKVNRCHTFPRYKFESMMVIPTPTSLPPTLLPSLFLMFFPYYDEVLSVHNHVINPPQSTALRR